MLAASGYSGWMPSAVRQQLTDRSYWAELAVDLGQVGVECRGLWSQRATARPINSAARLE